MKKTFVGFCVGSFCLLATSCTTKPPTRPTEINLIPVPQEMKTGGSGFELTSGSTVSIDSSNEALQGIVNYLNEKITPATGITLNVKANSAIVFELTGDASLGDEGYQLKVNATGIKLIAAKPAGIFYGVQTILQLLPPEIRSKDPQTNATWYIPAVDITDNPAFPWRGMMLDVSRHWFTKEEVMGYIDELATYKMNVFHWHLTDDQGWRIEIKSLPRLTEVGAWRAPRVGQWWKREPQQPGEAATYGGFYTQEEVREVLAYAAKRFVRVIPEIDVPGHSVAALVAYPELACMKAPAAVGVGNLFYGIDENTLCIAEDFTYEFMDKVLTEVAALFPDEFIHIGGDECYKGFWHKCPHCQALMRKEKLKDEDELQSYFIHRMQDIILSKGKQMIGWDEILEGGLAPGATVMSWRGMQGGIKAAQAGHKVIMTPADQCYIDLWQGEPSVEPDTYAMNRLRDSYSYNPVPDSVPRDMVLGGQANLWAESVPTYRHAEYMAWPRTLAIAEVLWSGKAKCDWDSFIPRVEAHFKRFDYAGVNYARSMYNAIITPYYLNDTLLIELGSELADSEIYYTFDNTDPDHFTPKYNAPLSIPKDATWLRVVTYRNGKPSGKVITLRIDELAKRGEKDKRTSNR